MTGRPGAVIGVFDRAGHRVDGTAALAAWGIPEGAYVQLEGDALAQYVVPADLHVLTIAGTEMAAGTSLCRVHLRDGCVADLHLFNLEASDGCIVAVLVPADGHLGSVAALPPPTAVEAGPRVGVLHADRNAMTVRVDDSILALLGWSRADLEGKPAANCIHPDDREEAAVNWVAASERRGIPLRWRVRTCCADGSYLWVECTIINTVGDDGSGEVTVELCDISKEVAVRDALAAEREALSALAEALPVGVAKFAAGGAVEYHNARLEDLLGLHDLPDVTALIGGDRTLIAAFAGAVQGPEPRVVAARRTAPDGTERFLEWTWRAIAGGGGIVCVNDVTEAIRLRAELEVRATTDPLTGCLNRAATLATIDSALHAARPGSGVSVVFLDIDHFKPVNDRWGHAVGDDVLQVVAEHLQRAVRPGDAVGRVGGDEFVLVAPGIASGAEALILAERVAHDLESMPPIGPERLSIGVSIGVAWADGGCRRDLLSAADQAMYDSKRERRRALIRPA